MTIKPKLFIVIGVSLMALGVLFPLLMVVRVIKAGFLISFLSYILSVAGLFLASMGGMTMVKQRRDDDRK